MNSKLLSLPLCLCLLASVASADFITGIVVDSSGIPVAGVNISAKSASDGGNGNLANGGTDANGFFNASIDPGTYRITFEPPPPPAAVALVTDVDDVLVLGVTSMGSVVLGPASSLHARLIRAGNIPVQGVNIDVRVDGVDIDLVGDLSNAQGDFNLAVPIGLIELRLDTTPVLVPLLAPHRLNVDMSTDVDLGDVLLEPGFLVSAAVLTTNFQGVSNLDVDVKEIASGVTIYTPGDNSDNNGFVDFVVPAGVFDFEFCPQLADNLVAHLVPALPIAATTSLGIITVEAGVRLSGTVTSHLGALVVGADLDVRNSATQASILLCGDNTDSSGFYEVVVPTGTHDLTFTPPLGPKLGSVTIANVVIAGDTIQNAVLPFCDCGTPSGVGTPGSGGFVPTIAASGGTLHLGNTNWGFDIDQGLGGAFGVAAMGFGPNCGDGLTPTTILLGGISLVSNRVRAQLFRLDGPLGQAGAGSHHGDFAIPGALALVGSTLSVRAQIFDAGAANGRALTPVLCGAICQ